MHKKLRRIFSIGTVFLLILLLSYSIVGSGQTVQAKDAKAYTYSSYAYIINSYDVKIRVGEDNIYHITETLDVFFNLSRHGIYRTIPERYTINRADGTKAKVVSRVENVSCGSDKFSLSKDGGNRVIKIGDKNRTLTGQHTYTISYDYIYGKDKLDGGDEFYFNIIANQGNNTEVHNMTFTVTMPKQVEEKNIGMSYGSYGSKNTDGIRWNFDGRKIEGMLDESIVLGANQYVTMRITMEEGYFTERQIFPKMAVTALALCVLFFLVSLVLWFYFGKEDEIIETVEFYPPDHLNCAEIACVYRGEVEGKDIVPLIVELAAKGYLQILETKKNSFEIQIVRDYDGNNDVERRFMKDLSKYGKVVRKSDLKDSFYLTINAIKDMLEKYWQPRIFITSTRKLRWLAILFAIIPYPVLLFQEVYMNEGGLEDTLILTFLPFVVVTVWAFLVHSRGMGIVGRILLTIIALGCLGVSYWFVEDALAYAGFFYTIAFIVCVFCNALQMLFFFILDKRSGYGTEMLGRIRGFKNFLETAEKDRLEMLVNENPEYFYQILPFTYVLDVSDKWMKRFEGIRMSEPSWYYSSRGTMFDYVMFNRAMDHMITSTTTAMTSSPSSSGGGSGGGFSGGGGGGGGTGSW